MNLVSKIVLGFALLLALAATAGWQLLSVVGRLHDENRQLAEISFEVADLGRAIRSSLDVLSEFSDKFLVLRDRDYFARLEQYRAEVGADLARLQGLDLAPAESAEVDRLAALWTSYLREIPPRERRVLEGSATGAGPEDLAALGSAHAERFAAMERQISRLLEVSRRVAEERVAASARAAVRAAGTARTAAAIGLLAALTVAGAIVVSIRRPLVELTRGTRVLARGDFTHRVPPAGSPELAALAEDFNTMAERLGELDRLKQDFVAGVSHDLRGPLASMEETTRVLLEGLAGPLEPRQRRMLELNLRANERLSALIGDLLDLRRLESGRIEYDLAPFDPVELIREAVAEIDGPLRRRELDLATELTPPLPAIEGDRALLLQAVRNVLSNAVKFTPDGGRLGVGVRPSGDGVTFEVWDSGPGVPDAAKTRIFDRFYRADGEGRGRQGTGLGLAIARTIVQTHDGSIRVEDREGGGSRFLLELPARPPGSAESTTDERTGGR